MVGMLLSSKRAVVPLLLLREEVRLDRAEDVTVSLVAELLLYYILYVHMICKHVI